MGNLFVPQVAEGSEKAAHRQDPALLSCVSLAKANQPLTFGKESQPTFSAEKEGWHLCPALHYIRHIISRAFL